MKKIKTIFAIGLTALLVSCGTSKETTNSKTSQNRGRNNTETASTTSKTKAAKTESSRTASANAISTTAANKTSEVDENARLQKMYSELDMSADQIARFEKDWRNRRDSWARNNRNKEMNSYERVEVQDRILRDILDDSQYETYQQWVRDQADRK